jgi:hypothetical protein
MIPIQNKWESRRIEHRVYEESQLSCICVRYIEFFSFYDFSFCLWNSSDNVVFLYLCFSCNSVKANSQKSFVGHPTITVRYDDLSFFVIIYHICHAYGILLLFIVHVPAVIYQHRRISFVRLF